MARKNMPPGPSAPKKGGKAGAKPGAKAAPAKPKAKPAGARPGAKKGTNLAAMKAAAAKAKAEEEARIKAAEEKKRLEEEERLRRLEEERLEEEARLDRKAIEKEQKTRRKEQQEEEIRRTRLLGVLRMQRNVPEGIIEQLHNLGISDAEIKRIQIETFGEEKPEAAPAEVEEASEASESDSWGSDSDSWGSDGSDELEDWEREMLVAEGGEEAEKVVARVDRHAAKAEKEAAEKEAAQAAQAAKAIDSYKTAEELEQEQTEADLARYIDPTLRSPICVFMGHVDTGKTSLLDKIRQTNVQDNEVGGITQQIGATFFPAASLYERTKKLSKDLKFNVPGLLVIDTPGHAAFTNLRSRGSSLCDVAVLVVDIMHGIEPQTVESLKLILEQKVPFIIALNKVDRLQGWKAHPDMSFRDSYKLQNKLAKHNFEQLWLRTQKQLSEDHGVVSLLAKENRRIQDIVSVCPTSAHTGEGIPDLLAVMVTYMQRLQTERIRLTNEFKCTVLEVKKTEGYGSTVDVILTDGELRNTDTLVVAGKDEPVVTRVRTLLTPKPLREMRVKGDYLQHTLIKAAMGVKIAAHDLENVIAGSPMYVARTPDEIPALRERVQNEFQEMLAQTTAVDGAGVLVTCSTLGSLEALLHHLETCDVDIPVAHIYVGDVTKNHIHLCKLQEDNDHKVILAFNVRVPGDVQQLANQENVKVFASETIYNLVDDFKKHQDAVEAQRRAAALKTCVRPVKLQIMHDVVPHRRAPLIVGMRVVGGHLSKHLPVTLGRGSSTGHIETMEIDMKDVTEAGPGDEVCCRISSLEYEKDLRGKEFIYSKMDRTSIDTLKKYCREELTSGEWRLVREIKEMLGIE